MANTDTPEPNTHEPRASDIADGLKDQIRGSGRLRAMRAIASRILN